MNSNLVSYAKGGMWVLGLRLLENRMLRRIFGHKRE
jgi:hypothetical protein